MGCQSKHDPRTVCRGHSSKHCTQGQSGIPKAPLSAPVVTKAKSGLNKVWHSCSYASGTANSSRRRMPVPEFAPGAQGFRHRASVAWSWQGSRIRSRTCGHAYRYGCVGSVVPVDIVVPPMRFSEIQPPSGGRGTTFKKFGDRAKESNGGMPCKKHPPL